MNAKTARLRVVIADDHPEMVKRAAELLGNDFDIVATAHDGISALDCIRRLNPDIALIDLSMPGMTGLDIVRALKESAARTVAVIITGYTDPDLSEAAIAAGAMAFVTKSRLNHDLVPALHAAVAGTVFVSNHSGRKD